MIDHQVKCQWQAQYQLQMQQANQLIQQTHQLAQQQLQNANQLVQQQLIKANQIIRQTNQAQQTNQVLQKNQAQHTSQQHLEVHSDSRDDVKTLFETFKKHFA